MKTLIKNSLFLAFAIMSIFILPGCEAIGDIFKAGIWVGVIAVIAVIAIIALIAMLFKK